MIDIDIQTDDVCTYACDVLVLKYAQAFHGASYSVVDALGHRQLSDQGIAPKPGDFALIPSGGLIQANQILFVGVVRLHKLDYAGIRAFAAQTITILAKAAPQAQHIGMTMHGVGYGLDEQEAFLAQIGGITDGLPAASKNLRRISIIERNTARAERLKGILRGVWPSSQPVGDETRSSAPDSSRIVAGIQSEQKPHVFVAMPFSKDLEDVYVFGIQGPVNSAGYLCERVDMAVYTGDILSRIKSRIETASLVVADLSGANANVYLEVGYAWGKDRPTLLLIKNGDELKFDVKGQRCIMYHNIVDLSKRLADDLKSLQKR